MSNYTTKNVKIIRVEKGEEAVKAKEIAAVYNNCPAGTHPGRAVVSAAGDDLIFTINVTEHPGYARNMEKRCEIIRAAKGEEAEAAEKIAAIYNSLKPTEVASRLNTVNVGSDLVYVLFTDTYPEPDDDDDEDDDDEAEGDDDDCDDWIPFN